jgi:hypothetical protein
MNNWEITTPEEISSLSLDVLTEKMLRKKRQAKEMSVEEEQVEEKQEVNQTPVAEKQKVDQMRTEEAKTAAAQEEQAFKQYTLAKGDTVWGELREDKGQEGASELVRNYEETASERLVDAGAFETQNEAKKYLDYSFRRMAIGAGFEASPEQIRVEDFFSPEKIEQYKQKKQSRKDYVLGEDIVKKLEESGDLPKTELPEKYLNAKGEERSIDSVVANELGYIPESMGGKGPQLTEEQKKEAAKTASRERFKMKLDGENQTTEEQKEAIEGKSVGEKAAEFLVGGIQAYREAGEAAVKSKEGDEKLTQLEKEIDTIRKEYKGADLEKKNQLEKDYLRLSAKKAEVLGEWEVANTYLAKMSDKQALGLSLGAASNIAMVAPVATAGSTAAKAAQGATGRVLGRQIAKGVAGAAAEGAIGGAGESAAAAMAQDASTGEIAKSAAVGGVIGTGLGITLGAGGALTGKLVKKFKKGVPDEAAEAIASKANAKAEEMRAEGASNQEIAEEVERVIKETDPERAKLLEAKRKGDRKKVVELAEKTDKIDEKETLQRLKKDAQKDPEARKAVAERVFGEEPKPDPKKEAIQRVLTDEPLTPEGKKRFEAEGLEPDEETIKQLVETNPEKAKKLLNEETYQKYTTEAPQAGKLTPEADGIKIGDETDRGRVEDVFTLQSGLQQYKINGEWINERLVNKVDAPVGLTEEAAVKQIRKFGEDEVEKLKEAGKGDLIDDDGYITLYHGGRFKGDKIKADDDGVFFLTDNASEAAEYANLPRNKGKGGVTEIKVRPEFVRFNEGSGEFEISTNLVKKGDRFEVENPIEVANKIKEAQSAEKQPRRATQEAKQPTPEQATKPAKGELDLAQEAKKYKSVEEFVESVRKNDAVTPTNKVVASKSGELPGKIRMGEVLELKGLREKFPEIEDIQLKPSGAVKNAAVDKAQKDSMRINKKYFEKVTSESAQKEYNSFVESVTKKYGEDVTLEKLSPAEKARFEELEANLSSPGGYKLKEDAIPVIIHELEHIKQNITTPGGGTTYKSVADLKEKYGEKWESFGRDSAGGRVKYNEGRNMPDHEVEAFLAMDRYKTKSELKEIYNKAQKPKPKVETKQPTPETKPFKPEVSPEKQPQLGEYKGPGKQVTSKVIEREFGEDIAKEMTFSRYNLKEGADQAAKVINQDPKKAYNIALGLETTGEDAADVMITNELVNKANPYKNKDGDAEVWKNLVTSNARRGRAFGQGLNAMKSSVDGNSAEVYLKRVVDERLKRIKPPKGFKDATEYINNQSKNLTQKVRKVKKQVGIEDVQSFFDKITCKV